LVAHNSNFRNGRQLVTGGCLNLGGSRRWAPVP
jgi:hypothetical protein